MQLAEIFSSIQGESSFSGLPCTFVRLAGCNLDCSYCDTRYAREGGDSWTSEQILRTVKEAGFSLVALTGGEPLLQEESYRLMHALRRDGYTVLLETNGSIGLERVDRSIVKIMDLKCPGSGMSDHMLFSNISCLGHDDEVKFVVSDKRDFDWAVRVIREYDLVNRCGVLISPVHTRLTPAAAAEWVLREKLPLRLQLQLHKVIWPDKAQGSVHGY